MREFFVQKGKYKGTHYIFEDTTEAIKYLTGELAHLNINNQNLSNPLAAFRYWHEFDWYKPGDWVKSDDGRIVQCLNVYTLYTKDKKTGKIRYIGKALPSVAYSCKIALGLWTKRMRKDGRLTETRMDLDTYWQKAVKRARHSIATVTIPGGKYMNDKKRLFAFYCVVTCNPIKAYRKVYPDKCQTEGQQSKIVRKTFFLLTRPEILKELQKYMSLSDFKNRLKEALLKTGVDEEKIAEEYVQGLESAKKGSQSHRQFIELGIQMLKYLETISEALPSVSNEVQQLQDPTKAVELLEPPDLPEEE